LPKISVELVGRYFHLCSPKRRRVFSPLLFVPQVETSSLNVPVIMKWVEQKVLDAGGTTESADCIKILLEDEVRPRGSLFFMFFLLLEHGPGGEATWQVQDFVRQRFIHKMGGRPT
jgi:hypothetical protein